MTENKNSYSLSSGTNEFFVNQLYDKFLNRVADGSGKLFWETALGQGVSRDTVILDFVKSSEYSSASSDVTSYVSSLYKNLLNRPADAEGIAYWTDSLKNGVSKTTIAQAFLNSSEFYNLTDFGSAGLLFSRDAAGNQVVSPTEVFKEIEGDAHTSHQFYVQLTNAPTKDVKLYLETSDLHAGKLQLAGEQSEASRIELNFTPNNWATAQAFNVLAKDDGFAHQDQSWKVFALTNSQDAVYDYFRPNKTGEAISVWATNTDQAGVSIHKLDFDLLSKGQSGNVGLVLTSKPTADVYLYVRGLGGHFNINGSPAFDEQVFKFTPQNWNIEQKAILQHADVLFNADSKSDSIVVDIRSSDSLYNSLADKTYALPIIDRGQSSNPLNSIDVNSGSGSQGSAIFAQTTNANSVVDDAIVNGLKQAASFFTYTFDNVNIPFIGSLKDKTTEIINTLQKSIDATLLKPNSTINDDSLIYDTITKNFTLTVKDALSLPDTKISSDLGISGLSFNAIGNIGANLNYDLILKGGWNSVDNFYLDQAASKFDTSLDLSGKNLSMEGLLGPLSISAVNQASQNSNKTLAETGVSLKANLNLKQDVDGKLTLAEAQKVVTGANSLNDAVKLSVTGDGQLSLGVTTKTQLPTAFGGTIEKFIPTYTFDLTAPFTFNYNPLNKNADGSPVTAGLDKIYLDNTQLNVSDFATNTLKPFVSEINTALKPIIGISDYFLKATGPWPIQDFGTKFAEDFTSGWERNFIGKELKAGVASAINAVSKSVDAGYQKLFSTLDGLDLYNEQQKSVKDNLISPLELLKSGTNLYYNLAYDSTNTINSITKNVKASLEAAGISSGIISEVNTSLTDLFNKNIVNNPQSKQIASDALKAVSVFQSTLEHIQEIKTSLTAIQNFQETGFVKLGNVSVDVGLGSDKNPSIDNSTLVGSIKTLVDQLKIYGFDIPALQSGKFLIDTIQGIQSDAVLYAPKIDPIVFPKYELPFSVLKAFALPEVITKYIDPQLNINFSNQVKVGATIAGGIDNQALIDWVKSGANANAALKLIDGFYIKDSGSPEFYTSVETKLSADGTIKNEPFTLYDEPYEKGFLTTSGSIYLRAFTNLSVDIKDSGGVSGAGDGKVRPTEIGATLANFSIPFTGSTKTDLFAGFDFNGKFGQIKIGDGIPSETSLGSLELLLF